jgi:SAM-dependent methyltransferase
MRGLRSVIRDVIPRPLLSAYREYRLSKSARRDELMSAEEVFTDIYTKNRWGGPPGSFCSGSGSHEASIVSPYIARIRSELDLLGGASLTVVDLGCGDFSVGRQLASACGHYVGVDIVKPLIEYNLKTYGTPQITFRHANMITDELPDADVCIVRQVLQHLSNAEILAVLPKLFKYRWCFITEHHPSPGLLIQPNGDKSHGGDIRVTRGSGVFLDQPPFSVSPGRYRLLLEVPGAGLAPHIDPGIIRTFILDNSTEAHPRATQHIAHG